jgi:hypothetical protein
MFLPSARVYLSFALVIYLPSFLDGSEKTGGRPSRFVQQWAVWGWYKNRVNLELINTTPLDKDASYIFGLHPHGVLPFGSMINLATAVNGCGLDGEKDPSSPFFGIQIRLLAASFTFYLPLYRDLLLGGGICDAARYCARHILDSGFSLVLVPGGATEALYAGIGQNTLVLKRRTGFVRLALQTGSHLVPCYTFGENDVFATMKTSNPVVKTLMATFQSVFGISLPLLTSIVPRSCKCTTVIGAAIRVPKIDNPDESAVEKYLNIYIEAVTELFNDNKESILGKDSVATLTIL